MLTAYLEAAMRRAHYELLEDVHISPRVVLGGGVSVGPLAHVGIGAVVLPGAVIGEEATVGAGAVVLREAPAHRTVIGVPAKVLLRVTSTAK